MSCACDTVITANSRPLSERSSSDEIENDATFFFFHAFYRPRFYVVPALCLCYSRCRFLFFYTFCRDIIRGGDSFFFLSLSRISTLTVLLYFSPLLSLKKDSSSILRENAWRCFLRCLKFYFSSEKGAFFPPKIYPLASLLIFSKRPQNFSQLFENLHASIILFHDFFNSPRLSLPRALYIF